jgi:hypothetical protein
MNLFGYCHEALPRYRGRKLELVLNFGAVIAVLWLNIVATHRIWRSISFTKKQKKYQYFIVWCLPIIGAAIVLAVGASDRTTWAPDTNDGKPKGRTVGLLVSFLLLDFHMSSASNDGTVADGIDTGDP